MSLLLDRLQKELERIKPATILIVEPDKTVADLLCENLNNYHTVACLNGRDALNFCQETPPNLILIDSNLPDMNALDLFQQIIPLKFVNNIPVFFIGQRNESRDKRMQALELGVDDFIHKPFDVVELQFRIKNALPESSNSVDLVTNLPTWPTTHKALQNQLHHNGWQAILIRMLHMDAYLDLYGTIAGQRVRRSLTNLLNDAVDEHGAIEDFIGTIGEGHFIIITHHGKADQIVADFKQKFKAESYQWYASQERASDCLQLPDGRRAPLMSVSTAVVNSQTKSFSNSLDIVATLETICQQNTPQIELSEQRSTLIKAIFATS